MRLAQTKLVSCYVKSELKTKGLGCGSNDKNTSMRPWVQSPVLEKKLRGRTYV
jgi:hypothetical protein